MTRWVIAGSPRPPFGSGATAHGRGVPRRRPAAATPDHGRADRDGTHDEDAPHPQRPGVAAGVETVEPGRRPQRVRGPVDVPPGPYADPGPPQAAQHDHEQDVRREGAQAQPQRPVHRPEQDHQVEQFQLRVRVEEQADHVDQHQPDPRSARRCGAPTRQRTRAGRTPAGPTGCPPPSTTATVIMIKQTVPVPRASTLARR